MAQGHTAYSISELDMAMIKAVPPGGNWKNIPESVPSKRLDQIRISGGRTTLYGRLKWDSPSYTITTYFNRPGNGCYIHPRADRVITSLEAARLQTFPDTYIFSGSKTSRTKQIGNAVPPILAYEIGRKIRSIHPSLSTTVDLFCGAGGLTLGFRWAGFSALAANDFFREAGETFQINNPEVDFISGDVTSKLVQDNIMAAIDKAGGVDVVIGGPPCQGFSNAGYRMIDDPRNSLYKNFVSIVDRANPKIFIMENVEGIMSINNGKTFQEIKETFRSLGYVVEGRKLLAVEFGVPQKRKRVFIIGSKLGDPSSLFPEPNRDSESYLTVEDAIGDLDVSLTLDVFNEVAPAKAKSDFQRFMQGVLEPSDYLNSK
jgi:DNA (cytosine-5)-methyltransferase 1